MALQCASAGCSLFNPLDYLQADGDPADLPAEGCPPEEWETCGVTVVAKPGHLGDINVTFDGAVYYTDQTSGEILKTTCDASGCTPATVVVSGEDGPRRLAHNTHAFVWTTRTEIRHFDLAGAVETVSPVGAEAEIAGNSYLAFWTDATGARGCASDSQTVECQINSLWSQSPATAPLLSQAVRAYFFADGEIKRCEAKEQFEACTAEALPGSRGAELIAEAPDLGKPSEGQNSLLASLAGKNGKKIVLAEQLDQAGKPIVLLEEPRGIVALAAYELDLYWITATGELRRKLSASTDTTAILRGLSSDATLIVTDDGVTIGDRGRNQVLRVVP